MWLNYTWISKILNNLLTIYPTGVKFGLGKQQYLCYKWAEADIWYLFLLGSDNLLKKFERLYAKPEMLYSWNENVYRKTKTAHM